MVLLVLSDKLADELDRALTSDIARSPVRASWDEVHDPLHEHFKMTGRAGQTASAPLLASPDLVTATKDGLYVEIAIQIDIWNATHINSECLSNNVCVAVIRGLASDGQVCTRAALAEPKQLNDDFAKAMRRDMSMSDVEFDDTTDALSQTWQTERLSTEQPIQAIRAL